MILGHAEMIEGNQKNKEKYSARAFQAKVENLHEPFAGSAAISRAAGAYKRASRFHINDLNKPLIDLWRAIVNTPEKLAKEYKVLWTAQLDDPKAFYKKIRDEFNLTGRPDYFLYILARCVMASV